MAAIVQKPLLTKSQAAGAQELDLEISVVSSLTSAQDGGQVPTKHQLQIEVSAVPDAGTLAIGGRNPGASSFVPIGTIDLTGTDLIQVIEGVYGAFELTPTDLDAGKTYSAHVVSYA